jgi:hypothetical protein
MAKSKYHHFNVGLNAKMMLEIRKETQRLGISKQEFIRSLVKEYFIRVHGRDLVFEQSAPKNNPVFNPTDSEDDYFEEGFTE